MQHLIKFQMRKYKGFESEEKEKPSLQVKPEVQKTINSILKQEPEASPKIQFSENKFDVPLNDELSALKTELADLKKATSTFIESYKDQQNLEPKSSVVQVPLNLGTQTETTPPTPAIEENEEITEVVDRLLNQGISTELCDDLKKYLVRFEDETDVNFEELTREWIGKNLNCETPDENSKNEDSPFICAVVGPTGVGKTTTLAKLAARRVLKRQQVALISLDTYRIAAVDQLKTYANLLKIPIEVCHNEKEFRAALSLFRDKDAVFIDTSGHSQRSTGPLEHQLQILKNADVHISLVMSLTSRESVLRQVAETYQDVEYNDLIFTKLDESIEVGSVMNLTHACQKPVAFLTDGQQVPEDIKIAKPIIFSNIALNAAESVKK